MSTTMMNRNLIHAFANLALVCPTTAWSQKEVMATINGSDAYTGSGYAQGDEVRITIKPGERVVAGKVETQLVAGEFHPKAYVNKEGSFDAPSIYKVIATLDLDGDGKLEVVVGSNYYEGEEITIYRCDPKKVETLLSVACRCLRPISFLMYFGR
jgi:FG-GAP repeat